MNNTISDLVLHTIENGSAYRFGFDPGDKRLLIDIINPGLSQWGYDELKDVFDGLKNGGLWEVLSRVFSSIGHLEYILHYIDGSEAPDFKAAKVSIFIQGHLISSWMSEGSPITIHGELELISEKEFV